LLTDLDVSNCINLKRFLECSNNLLTSLNLNGCENLEVIRCTNNLLKSLDVSSCKNLSQLYCQNNKINSEIPEWFSQLTYFKYDRRYTYYLEAGILKFIDAGFGWWYPGEPEKGYHRW